MEGQISEAGHIHGIYYALDPHDRSISNFFLFISHNREMDGLWSGYDSVNQKITSGKYKFRPVLQKITLSDLTEEDIPSIIAISDEELGKDYLTVEHLRNISDATDGIKTFCKVANESDHEVIGFCTFSLMTSDELKNRLKIPSDQIPKALFYATKIGMIDVVSVKDEFKRQGIGFNLVSEAISQLNN